VEAAIAERDDSIRAGSIAAEETSATSWASVNVASLVALM
jgi:hypothetical protein